MQDKKIFKRNQLETRYNFARQLRLLREEKGLSVKEFAKEIHMLEKYIWQLELGKIENFGAIFALAQFFDKKVKIEFY